jgi:hypothetical protein
MKIADFKLFQLMDSFSERETKEFRKLVSSGFFSGGRNYIHILNKLLKFRKSGMEKLTPQLLYKKLYPGSRFSLQTLNNRFSELFKLGEEFLIYKTLRENSTEKDRILLLAYHNNKSKKLFLNRLSRAKKTLDDMPESDSKYLYLSNLDRLSISFSKDPVISENTYRQYFQNSQNFTALLLKSLFDFGFEFLQQEQTNRSFEFNLVNEIISRLEMDDVLIKKLFKSNIKIFKIVVLEYYLFNIFKNPENEKNYYEARKLFADLKSSMEDNYKTEAYKKMTNYCILRQNQGVKTFNIELFNLYNEMLKQKIYLDHKNEFSQTTFRNYVLIGIILRKIKWTENFIKKHSVELPEEIRKDEINLSYSKLFFSLKNYEKSLQYISGLKNLNTLHYSDSAILKLCNYYETGKFEEAYSETDKFRHYIRNHIEMPKIHKEYALNFLKIYKMLLKIKTGVNKKDLYQTEDAMKKLKLKSRASWLTEKISELQKK